mgnify:CR=1 FL=1
MHLAAPTAPPRIRLLAPELVNKIAAGEVIERPASVVKELLENAFDAGSRRVELEVEEGGLRLLRVTDDGAGIEESDLPLAVESHATSKISAAEDLFAIGTLGFRGEALASIASVSRLRLASRPRACERGAELRVEGGELRPVRPAAMAPGTIVEVADLFWNVPARRAFQKGERAELRAVLAEARRQALCRPEVGLRVRVDGGVALEAPPEDEPRARIAQLLGAELAEGLLALPRSEAEGVRLRGYASPLDRSRGDSQQQWFFLNGRAVRDVTLLSAVKTAYADLLPPRRHASVLLWLEVPADEVDVNVHPQKAEVRFRRAREVYGAVVRAIREAVREAGGAQPLLLRRRGAELPATVPVPPLTPAPRSAPAPQEGGQALIAPLFAAGAGEEAASAPAPSVGRFLQLHRRYVLEETASGVRFVDPHALHERILYQEILARLRREPLESQRFLFPQVLPSDPLLRAALPGRSELLHRLGFEVEPFGPAALAIHAAPRLLRAERAIEAVRALLEEEPEDLEEGGPDPAARLLHELAATLACKAAVRFGDELPAGQLEELLQRRATVQDGHCCPHGRPTTLELSLDELDHRFQRQGLVR